MTHTPVLMQEVLQVFHGKTLKTFFDGTLGGGGHAMALLQAHPEIERYVACDKDPRAHDLAKKKLEPWKDKLEFVRGSFASAVTNIEQCLDGFLIDIGVSSMQLDEAQRGFSFMKEAPLDMRMDPDADLTAAYIVNRYPEKELARIFFEYGEERKSRQIAKAIVEMRKKRPIATTIDLVEIIKKVSPSRGHLHPATLVFQALRIEVNGELEELQSGLKAAMQKMCPGGRMAVITFHSGEDRIAKNVFRDAKAEFSILTKKPLIPTREEIKMNPRSRSSKLRAVEKL